LYGAVHDTTLPVELKNAQYAGLLDPGRYKVSVKMSNKAKECITSMRIFGNEEDLTEDCYTDDGCTHVLHPVTEPKIEFQFSSDPECMKDMSVYITIVPVTTDETKLDDKMAFQIGLRPLAVSFEYLVRVVANPYFGGISDRALLSSEVGYLLAKAALGKISNWKNEIPPHTNEPVVDAGDTKVQISFNGSDYCYYSPDKKHWEWRLCSSKGWPVFVKDAEDWKKISERCDMPVDVLDNFAGTDLITRCAYVCDPIKETIDETYGSGAYNNYLLTVKFKDSECEGLSGYGSRESLLDNALAIENIGKITAAYGTACAGATLACGAITSIIPGLGGESVVGSAKSAAFDCFVAPATTVAVYNISKMLGFGEGSNEVLWAGALLGPTAIGTARTLVWDMYKAKTYIGALEAFSNGTGNLTTEDIRQTAKKLAPLLEKLKKIGLPIDNTQLGKIKQLETADAEKIEELLKTEDTKINFKDIKKALSRRNILKLEKARALKLGASVACRTFGAILGTAVWYTTVESGLKIPEITVEIQQLSVTEKISTESAKIITSAKR